MRKMRRLSASTPEFIREYNEAVDSGLTYREFLDLTGMGGSSLWGRLATLSRRGVVLRPLKGMRRRTKLGKMLGVCPVEPKREEAPVHEPVAEAPAPAAPPPVTSFSICVGTGI